MIAAFVSRFSRSTLALACVLTGLSLPLHAADVVVQPTSGSGFVVKDANGANERLRVQESGAVSLPAVPGAPAQPQGLCMGAGGQLGPCSGDTGGGSYSAGIGLTLTGTMFSVAPSYRLSQTCVTNEFARWNGTAWDCGTAGGGATLPAGTANQTLRYDASNTLVANNQLQAFSDGGLVATSTSSRTTIPPTGAGVRLMWYPFQAAFRVGSVDASQWDDTNIGTYSVAMGNDTTASGDSSTAIGKGTTASGTDGAMAVGYHSVASGPTSMAIGDRTFADANNSIAMGNFVGSGGHSGSFIFGDSSRSTGIVNDEDNQFVAIANRGFKFVTSSGGGLGAILPHNATAWAVLSDRNAKTAVQLVDPRDVLKKVAKMPLSTWQYKEDDAGYRHMGPMAQDFYAAFHLGDSDKRISTIDADGVTLAAIQGLNARLDEKDREMAQKDGEIGALRDKLATQEMEIAKQKTEIAKQNTRVVALESLAGELAEMKSQLAALRDSRPPAVTVALRQP